MAPSLHERRPVDPTVEASWTVQATAPMTGVPRASVRLPARSATPPGPVRAQLGDDGRRHWRDRSTGGGAVMAAKASIDTRLGVGRVRNERGAVRVNVAVSPETEPSLGN